VEVASKWTIPEGRRQLLDNLASAACQNGLGGPSAYATLVRFLVEMVHGGEEGARPRVFEVWWSFVRRSWSESKETSERIEELWRAVEPIFADRPTEGAELLATSLLPSLAESTPSSPVATVLLRISLSSLRRAEEGRPWSHATSRALIETLGRAGALEPALSAVRSDGEALVEVAYRLLDTGLDEMGGWDSEAGRQFQQEVGRALGSVLAHTPAAQAAEVRAKLAQDERWDVLLGEWLGLLEGAHDLRDRYRAYRSQVLSVLPGYRDAREPDIAATLLDRLGRGDARKQAAAWVEDRSLERFSEGLAARCVALANEAVPLVHGEAENKSLDRMAEEITAAAERYSIELDPDRPFLYRSLKALRARRTLDEDLRNRLGEAIGRLSAGEASDYLETALPLALERAENLNDHRTVLAALVPRETAEAAIKGYRSFIGSHKSRFPPPLKMALRFWLQFDSSDAETRHLEKLRKAAQAELVRVLAELPQRTRSRIPRKDIRHDVSHEPSASRWEEIERAIERRQRNPLRKLMNVFRGERRG
jgi:hypothetical protein